MVIAPPFRVRDKNTTFLLEWIIYFFSIPSISRLVKNNCPLFWSKHQLYISIYFGKIGYQRRFIEAGLTAFSIDYGHYENLFFDTRPGFEKDKYRGRTVGIALIQYLDRIATELYVGFRNYELKHPALREARYKDVKAVMGGIARQILTPDASFKLWPKSFYGKTE